MSKLNIGLESLLEKPTNECEFTVEDVLDMALEEMSIQDELNALKEDIESCENLISICDALEHHGGYAGFESLVAEHKELSELLGIDICTASAEELADIYSKETIADALNKLGSRIQAFFGRIGDRINNVIKTILPFKEKYLKEMTDLKLAISGKKFDEEKFAGMKVASALSKQNYNSYMTAMKKAHDAMAAATKYCSDKNLDDYLSSVDAIPGQLRTSLWGTVQFRPYLSWFKKDTCGRLGFKASDAAGVCGDGVDLIKGLVDLQGLYGSWWKQTKQMERSQSFERAQGNKEKAAEIRKAVSNMNNFFWTVLDSINAYEIAVRRGMYFCTYLGRAAKSCIQG